VSSANEIDKTCGRGSISPLHYRYCIVILILFCIALASDRWTGQEGFTDYLSNAATITSLLLGLIAIIYSFFSNGTISSNLGGISSAARDVEKVGGQIGDYLEVAKNIDEAGRKSLISLEEFSSKVTRGLDEFSLLLREMDKKNSSMHALVSNLPGKIDDIGRTMIEVGLSAKTKPEETEDISPDESARQAKPQPILSERAVDRFFERSSLTEIGIAYCCALSRDSSKVIDVGHIADLVGGSSDAVESYIRCMDALGLVAVYWDDDLNTYKYSGINRVLYETVKRRYEEEIKNHGGEFSGFWLKIMAKIEAHYSAQKEGSK
jgi:hypothetical protein